MRKWWTSIQPTWRRVKLSEKEGKSDEETSDEESEYKWPPPRTLPPGTDQPWFLLRRGGANGFYIVMMGTAWCYWHVADGKPVREFSSMLEDISWTLKNMVAGVGTDLAISHDASHKRDREPEREGASTRAAK